MQPMLLATKKKSTGPDFMLSCPLDFPAFLLGNLWISLNLNKHHLDN